MENKSQTKRNATAFIHRLRNLTDIRVSPNSDIHQGVQVEANFSSSRIKVPGLLASFVRRRSRSQTFPKTASASGFASASVFAPALALAIAVLGISLFSQTAYAASYINVSSGAGGTVSLGSIKPSSTGVSASGSDTLTITTNCSAGYSVYVSAQNGGDTNLTNTNSSVTSNNTISASSTVVGSTATTLNSNTWGITGDSASASASKYVGLPSYADATNTALISNSSASTTGDNKSTVYYGVKVDTTLSPGTYSGDALYTTLVSDKCNNYTVHFDANGGSGSMSDQTIPVGTTTPLTANAFSRSGYAFLGWSTSASGKTGTASNGIGTEADVDYRDGQSVTDIASFNSTINLYAIWLAVDSDMQSFSTCANLSAGESKILRDTRDNKAYAIKKLPDGKCWMMQNLTIGMNGAQTLTSANTNIDNNTTYYLPPAGKQGSDSIDKDSTLTATDTANFGQDAAIDQHAKTQFRTKNSSYTNDSDTGYYNFYTATLGFSSYNDGKTTGTSSRDICPAGWRLPKVSTTATTASSSGDFTGDFAVLSSTYNPSASWINGVTENRYTSDDIINDKMYLVSASPLADSTQNDNAGFSHAGYWRSTYTVAITVGSYGYYWSSSVYDADRTYNLLFYSSNVYPQNGNLNKYFGSAVRCLAQYDYLVSYSSDGSDSGEPSKTSDGAVLTSDSVQMPTQGTLAKDGYEFKGWALTSGAAEATYTAEQTVTISALITAASSAGQATTPGSTITLYPVWESSAPPDDGNLGTMQDFICNNLTSGHTATLTDSRDNQTYTVYRIPTDQTYEGIGSSTVASIAGKCLMTQDLSLGYVTGGSITKGSNLVLSTDDSAGSTTSSAPIKFVDPANNGSDWSGTDSDTNLQYTNGPRSGYDAYSRHTYYSWGAALVVCPKGWRLPTSAEYGSINSGTQTSGLAAIVGNSADGSKALQASPWSFVLGGYFYSSGWGVQGSSGFYWSSTQYDSSNGHGLFFNSSSVYRSYSSKNVGRSVRCIADPYEEGGTMQSAYAAYLPEGKTVILTDSRDEQKYTAYRWPSTGTAGTDYPTGMAGYAIMTKDLSLGYVTGGSIIKDSNLVLSTDDSAAAATITARTGTSDWSRTNADSNLQYINGPQSGKEEYSSHSYYSYGAAQRVCPKGWRPPTNTEYSNIKTFMGGDNSTGSSKIRGVPYNFVYGGEFNSSGWSIGGGVGLYWSSTQYSSANGLYLYFDSGDLVTTFNRDKYSGMPVRCIAAP